MIVTEGAGFVKMWMLYAFFPGIQSNFCKMLSAYQTTEPQLNIANNDRNIAKIGFLAF